MLFLIAGLIQSLLFIVFQDRAKNPADRFSSTTTLTVNIKDDDDQDPSFIYQGCNSQGGGCVNPEYYASVSIVVAIRLFKCTNFDVHAHQGVPYLATLLRCSIFTRQGTEKRSRSLKLQVDQVRITLGWPLFYFIFRLSLQQEKVVSFGVKTRLPKCFLKMKNLQPVPRGLKI